MRNKLLFDDTKKTFNMSFAEKVEVIDGYPKGYNDGYERGKSETEANCETEKKHLSSSLSEALTSGATNTESLEDNIETAMADITAVKTVIESYDIKVPTGTISATYPALLKKIVTDEKADSKAEGIEEGIEQGKQAQYDEFWDVYQRKGGVYSGSYMFAHGGWNDTTFKPKYSMWKILNASRMFNTCAVTNLTAILKTLGVTFSFANCASMDYMIAYSKITHFPTIDTRKTSALSSICAYSEDLTTIDKLILKSDGTQTFSGAFTACTSLANIIVEGVIGNNISFSGSPLSKDSITSVINALSTTATGKTLTLKKSAVNNAFETVEGTADGSSSEEWAALIATKSNWTISLV